MSVRLFVSPGDLMPGPLLLSGDEHHYLSRVRRLAVGDEVTLMDGQGHQSRAEILSIEAERTRVQVREREEVLPPAFSLTIAPALIKGERMDTALSKMVELGVARIRPVITERTIVRPRANKMEARHKRFAAIVQAAARQSQNAYPAQIEPILSLEELLRDVSGDGLKLLPTLCPGGTGLKAALPQAPISSATVLVGPEGGFSEAEVSRARAADFIPVSLGPRILRAETACIAIASILGFRYGDLGRFDSEGSGTV